MRRLLVVLGLALVACAGAVGEAAAAPCASGNTAWDEPAGGDWNVDDNWTNGGPSSACGVQLPTLAGPYVVTISGTNEDVDSLAVSSGATLRIRGSASAQAQLLAVEDIDNGGTIVLDCEAAPCGAPQSSITLGATNGLLHNLPLGVITANVPVPPSGTALARLQGDLLNDGALRISNRATFIQAGGASTVTNNGSIELADGSHTDTQETITNATSGSIVAEGDGTIVVTSGVFNQGGGTVNGSEPVVLNGTEAEPGRLNLTGDGAGSFVLQGRTRIDGGIKEDQTITVLAFEGQPFDATQASSVQPNLTNSGTVILDCTTGTSAPCQDGLSTLSVPSGVFTNNGTLTTGAPGGNARIFGEVNSSGTVTIGDLVGLFSFKDWKQTGGTTTFAADGRLDVSPNAYALMGGGVTGSGRLTGRLVNTGGVVAPGSSPGTLTVGNYTQGAGGTLAIELDGTAAGQFDQLAVVNDVTLGGTVSFEPSAAFDEGPVVGATVPFLEYGGIRTATFAATAVSPPLTAGKSIAPAYDDAGTQVDAVVTGPDADGDGRADGQDGCPAQAATTADGCPEAQPPGPGPGPVPPLPIAPPDADGDGLSDSTDGCPTVAARTLDGCPAPPNLCGAASRVRNKTKRVAGGALVLKVSQTDDPAAPLRLSTTARKVRVASVAYTVNGTTLTNGSIPASVLRAGSRNTARAVVTLTNGRKATITQVLRLARCTQASIRCTRISGGAQLRCTSKLPRRARRVRVAVTGAVGQRAVGSTRVRRPRRGARTATYTVTLPATVAFAPGTYTYRHTVTTTRRGERLVVVRSIVVT